MQFTARLLATAATAAIASVGMTTAAQADQINLISVATRIAGANGLSDRFYEVTVDALNSNYDTVNMPSVIRPNGATDWGFIGDNQVSQFLSETTVGLDSTTAESWMQSNYAGGWQVSWDGSNTYTADTSPSYTSILSREYLELTADSVALFEDIRANGLTGTFTFTLAEPLVSKSQGYGYIQGSSGFTSAHFTGSTFELTVADALSADSALFIQYGTSAFLDTFASGDSAYMWQLAETVYGTGIVPAPGASALLGLAGLFARRRR